MSLTVLVAGTSYQVQEGSFKIQDRQNERSQCDFVLVDTTGIAIFPKGVKVSVSDSALGQLFTGVIHTAIPVNLIPQPYMFWQIGCVDLHYDADKRTINKLYTNQFASTIVQDMHAKVLAAEGVVINSAYRLDTAQADFAAGTLTNVVATSNVGDGDLELALAGTAVTFSQGPITFPSTSAIKMTGTQGVSGLSDGYAFIEIWSGSYTIVSGDVFNFDVWIASTSPYILAGIDFICTDGTQFTFQNTNSVLDVQNLTPYYRTGGGPAGVEELSGLASNQWYTRSFPITIGTNPLTGKTIQTVSAALLGYKTGNYTAYFRNVYINNGITTQITFFSTTATSFQITPQILQNVGYSNLAVSIVTTYNQSGSITSSPISLSAANLARSSFLTWLPSTTSVPLTITASIDGGVTYLPVPRNGAIPGLLPGMSLSGKTLTLIYSFSNNGPDPTVAPLFGNIVGNVQPSYVATKSDIVNITSTQAGWNAGTLTNLTAPGGNVLQLNGYARNWDNGSLANQTLYGSSGPFQFVINKQFVMYSNQNAEVRSRLDFAGSSWQNFTAEVDVLLVSSTQASGIIYRDTGWQNNDDTYAYLAHVNTNGITLLYGTNSSSGVGSTTTLSNITFATPLNANTWHHLKVVVNGSNHQVYLDNALMINVNDSTYLAAGYFGLSYINQSVATATAYFDNFGVVANLSGTWVSPAIDIHSLGTIQGSELICQIDPANASTTSVLLEISLNNGSTWATCTNGATVPGLTNGTNVSAMTQVLIRVTISTTSASTGAAMPDIQGVTLIVMGAYSSSGTRVTVPLGNDTMVRANQSGWGTAFDGQTWVKTGTGTDAISSNEATITNTTGDVHEVLGSKTGSDLDGTVRFQLSASTISAGMELRYQDANNFYRFSASTTTLTLLKVSGGVSYTIATASMTLTTGTYYRMRFRVVGSGYPAPVSLSGKVWADGTLEPVAWSITGSD